jgi:RecB family exonuclease
MKGPNPTPRNQWSFSRVKTFHQCPLRYRLRYLKGMREVFQSVESHLGKTVHAVLEWLYAERDRTASPGLEIAFEEYARAWEHGWSEEVAVIRVDDDPDELFRVGREMLERFHREVFSRDRSDTLALEQRLSLRLDGGGVFTGFADRVGRTTNGRLFVIDYKTSRHLGDGSDFSEGLQAPLYAACLLAERDDAEALAGYHYLRHGSTSWQSVNRERGREVVARFVTLVEEIDIATNHPARPGILCAWCGFNAVCDSAEVADGLAGGLRHAIERGALGPADTV